MIIRRLFLSIAIVAAFSGLTLSYAHSQKVAITTIEKNHRSGHVEIVHRFSQHDAEHVSHLFGTRPESIITSDKAQKSFADYVVKSFGIYEGDGLEIQIETIGYEFERGYFWLYQEVDIPDGMNELIVRNSALMDVFPEQVNTVNIELDGSVKTLTFSNHSQQSKVSFDP